MEGAPHSLIQGSDCNLYGTAQSGFSASPGSIFKITPDGIFTVLHAFTGGNDGNYPETLFQASDGNFYGTTLAANLPTIVFPYGSVFRMTPAGALTVLYAFTGGADGFVYNPLMQATDGNFYGSSEVVQGGFHTETIFRLTPTTGILTMLYTFDPLAEGVGPSALIQAADGSLYGTISDVAHSHFGRVFRLSATGAVSMVTAFTTSNDSDTEYPRGLLQGRDGSFYGVTQKFRTYPSIFRLTPASTFSIVYGFPQGLTNYWPSPWLSLIQTADGNLAGAIQTAGGGFLYRLRNRRIHS